MKRMDVTADTSQAPMFWLKASAKRNICDMVVTADTSHAPMFWLKTS
eukprot:CAMPEP_0198678836 /NCGR_PEP_ID=MMETSP1468-20131203/1628_1 /TAXON_ID=1461545 /ORGANISM="Mantoniella sp, Strain CCMP1436" /LENGTH=46 /DNA_ID= /DNA_START= /DNA_END= /DNA_ORIENTATION=